MTSTVHAFLGDSITQGTADQLSSMAQGGYGSWVELTRDLSASVTGIGPLVSNGLSPVARGVFPYGGTEWTQTGTWTLTTSSDAFDKAPFGVGWYAAGASNTAIYTHPRGLPRMVGFYVDWIDYTSGGTWSYRINGGSWTSSGQTPLNTNAYRRFYVSHAMDVGDTIEFRAANAIGATVGCFVVGIWPFYLAPSTTGLIINNIALGGMTLHAAVSGNHMTWLAPDILPPPPARSETPNSVSMMFLNDITILGNTTTWTTDLGTLHTALNGIPFGAMGLYEVDTGLDSAALQASYRAATKAACAGYSPACPVLDLFDEFNTRGMGGQGAQNAFITAANLLADDAHPSQLGHFEISRYVYKWVRDNFLTGGTGLPARDKAKARLARPTLYEGKITSPSVYKMAAPNRIK